MSKTPRINWRTQYDDDRDAHERKATDIHPGGPSLTIQGPTIDTDINEIVRRFGIGEVMIPPPADPTAYGDLSDLPDLRTVLDMGREAKERFNALPARLRGRFDNDPAKLWDFVNDPDNGEEAVHLGLLQRKPEPEETPIPVTPEPAKTAAPAAVKTDTQ